MGLVDDHHDLAAGLILDVVIPVFNDLVVQPLEHQKHLGICNGIVLIRQQGLEVKHDKVFVGADAGRSIPQNRISAAGGELGNIVEQHPQVALAVFTAGQLEIVEDLVVQVIKCGEVLRCQPA